MFADFLLEPNPDIKICLLIDQKNFSKLRLARPTNEVVCGLSLSNVPGDRVRVVSTLQKLIG